MFFRFSSAAVVAICSLYASAFAEDAPASAGARGHCGGVGPVRLHPIAATQSTPPYPDAAARDREVGLTVLAVTVGPDGSVEDDTVARSSGWPLLDNAALAYVKQTWRWQPPGENCVRGWLGIQLQHVMPPDRVASGIKGGYVANVVPNGPAAKAGLQQGDIVTGVDSWPVADADDLTQQAANLAPGTTATFRVNRQGVLLDLRVLIGANQADSLASNSPATTMVRINFDIPERVPVAHFKTGLWKDTEYRETNGIRTPCHAGDCIQFTIPPNLDPKLQAEMAERMKNRDQVCVATDILEKSVHYMLEQRALLMEETDKNCKAIDPITSETEHLTGMICDELTLSQKVSYPDNEHLISTTVIKSVSESGPHSGSTTMVAEYKWFSPDCGNATRAIREMPGVMPAH